MLVYHVDAETDDAAVLLFRGSRLRYGDLGVQRVAGADRRFEIPLHGQQGDDRAINQVKPRR